MTWEITVVIAVGVLYLISRFYPRTILVQIDVEQDSPLRSTYIPIDEEE